MTDSQPEGEEHLPADVAEPLQDVEEEVRREYQEEGGDGESSFIWTQDVYMQEELVQFHNESSNATTQKKNATYELCQILMEHLELYKEKISVVWDSDEEKGVGSDRKVSWSSG